MQAWWQDFQAWFASPTQVEMTPLHVFYITGLYVTCVIVWVIIINHILAAIRAGE